MTGARLASVGLLGATAAFLAFAHVYIQPQFGPVATRESERLAKLRAAVPDLPRTAIDARMAESDAIRRAQGDVNIDDRLNAVVLSDAELRAFWAQNPEIFHGRSFEESRVSADILARIQRVRADLDLPASARVR